MNVNSRWLESKLKKLSNSHSRCPKLPEHEGIKNEKKKNESLCLQFFFLSLWGEGEGEGEGGRGGGGEVKGVYG